MRVARKPKPVEAKRTRSCVVRLEKVRTPPSKTSVAKKLVNSRPSSNQKPINQNAGASSSSGKINNNAVRPGPAGINSKATKAAIMIINPSHTKSSPSSNAKSPSSNAKSPPNNTKSLPNMGKYSPITLSPEPEEKKFKGPLKKRPLNSQAASSTPSTKVREKSTTPQTPVARAPKQQDEIKLEDMPTIAAGRSRRAIKPNPKYASDDIVTPKAIKHAAQLTPAHNRKTNASAAAAATSTATGAAISSAADASITSSTTTDKKRNNSTSSSEDLYNKDSSDAEYMGVNEMLDENDGSDSDFSDFEFPATPNRLKIRAKPTLPDKTRQTPTPVVPSTNTKTPLTKSSTPTPKPLASHLQQLRKTIAVANANRLNKTQATPAGAQKPPNATTAQQQANALAKKRKIYESSNDSDSDSVSKRRKVYTSSNINKDSPSSTTLPNALPLNHKTLMSRKSLTATNTTVNGSKINALSTTTNNKVEPDPAQQLKRKILLEKPITNKPASKTLPAKPLNPIEPLKMASKPISKPTVGKPTAKPAAKPAAPKPRTDSPAQSITKPNKVPTKVSSTNKDEESKANKATDPTAASNTADDFETMPTFTIVNINDIINKKGDVLMTKAAGGLSKSSSKDSGSEVSEVEDEHTEKEPIDIKTPARRKLAHNKLLTEKSDTSRDKKSSPVRNSSFTPPVTKKPAQTILNHTLSNKSSSNKQNPRTIRTLNSSKSSTNSSNKPAPRILNSMVAKKTQPVKPLIANLDDSADESFSIPPLDHEDDDDDDEDLDPTTDEEEDASEFLSKSRSYAAKKKPSPAVTKENSSAATNRQTTLPTLKTPQRKISPEKVVISRQGDKIIKKITCFETWYIINLPDDRPAEVVRNQLEMPLIKLANAAKKVELPTSNWSSKVTLYHIAAGAQAKSSYTTYTGDLHDQNIAEEDRENYQPSCVMFRRAVSDRTKSRLPYDRAVIFKNRTFYTNIEGKNVKLVGAPFKISSITEVEILLQLVDELTLQSAFVEQAATVQ